MKKLVVIVVVLLMLGGCATLAGLRDKETGQTLPVSDVNQLPPVQAAPFTEPVTIKTIDPRYTMAAETALAAAQEVRKQYGGFLPGPWDAIVGLVLTVGTGVVGIVKTIKVVKQRNESKTREGTLRDVIGGMEMGASVASQGIEVIKTNFPDAWKVLGPLLAKGDLDSGTITVKTMANGELRLLLPNAA